MCARYNSWFTFICNLQSFCDEYLSYLIYLHGTLQPVGGHLSWCNSSNMFDNFGSMWWGLEKLIAIAKDNIRFLGNVPQQKKHEICKNLNVKLRDQLIWGYDWICRLSHLALPIEESNQAQVVSLEISDKYWVVWLSIFSTTGRHLQEYSFFLGNNGISKLLLSAFLLVFTAVNIQFWGFQEMGENV